MKTHKPGTVMFIVAKYSAVRMTDMDTIILSGRDYVEGPCLILSHNIKQYSINHKFHGEIIHNFKVLCGKQKLMFSINERWLKDDTNSGQIIFY